LFRARVEIAGDEATFPVDELQSGNSLMNGG
jgi:hypothetical protein